MSLSFGSRDGAAHLKTISDRFEGEHPSAVLHWAVETFGKQDVALATGFGVEGCALVDMLAEIEPNARMFYLDTGLLFDETHDLRKRLEARYGIRFERHAATVSVPDQARLHGAELWAREPDACCRIRKIEPLKRALTTMRAWITAIRRDQSPARATAGIVEWDAKFGLVKINPLAAWSEREVWRYIATRNVPYNPLHDRGFPSIGCGPCTSPVAVGEASRAGRWRGAAKTECGLHGE